MLVNSLARTRSFDHFLAACSLLLNVRYEAATFHVSQRTAPLHRTCNTCVCHVKQTVPRGGKILVLQSGFMVVEWQFVHMGGICKKWWNLL